MSDGHFVGVEHQNVGRHENGIAVKPHRDVGVRIPAGFDGGVGRRLVGVGAVHLALGRAAGKKPVEGRNFGNVALAVENHLVGVEARGKPGRGDLATASFNAGGILALDERVQVREEEKALNVGISAVPNGGSDGSDVVADVKRAGRVDAGKHSFGHL